MSIPIKLSFNGEVRRVTATKADFASLSQIAYDLFPILSNKPLTFLWKDDECDIICCSTNEEVEEAVRVMKSENKTTLRFDVETDEFSNNESAFVQYQESSPDFSEDLPVHTHVTCDECGMSPIKGIRYKCVVRKDFDLCEKCENSAKQPYPMIKIYHPSQAPIAVMVAIRDEAPTVATAESGEGECPRGRFGPWGFGGRGGWGGRGHHPYGHHPHPHHMPPPFGHHPPFPHSHHHHGRGFGHHGPRDHNDHHHEHRRHHGRKGFGWFGRGGGGDAEQCQTPFQGENVGCGGRGGRGGWFRRFGEQGCQFDQAKWHQCGQQVEAAILEGLEQIKTEEGQANIASFIQEVVRGFSEGVNETDNSPPVPSASSASTASASTASTGRSNESESIEQQLIDEAVRLSVLDSSTDNASVAPRSSPEDSDEDWNLVPKLSSNHVVAEDVEDDDSTVSSRLGKVSFVDTSSINTLPVAPSVAPVVVAPFVPVVSVAPSPWDAELIVLREMGFTDLVALTPLLQSYVPLHGTQAARTEGLQRLITTLLG